MTRVLIKTTYLLEVDGEDYFGEEGVAEIAERKYDLALATLDDIGWMDVFDHKDTDKRTTFEIVAYETAMEAAFLEACERPV